MKHQATQTTKGYDGWKVLRNTLLIIIVGTLLTACNDDKAMQQCMNAGYSEDTCFLTLHN